MRHEPYLQMACSLGKGPRLAYMRKKTRTCQQSKAEYWSTMWTRGQYWRRSKEKQIFKVWQHFLKNLLVNKVFTYIPNCTLFLKQYSSA